MNWLQRLVARVLPTQPGADRIYLPFRTQAGVQITEDSALKYATVWRCIDVTAKAIAILPWSVFERTKTGRKEQSTSDVRWMLHNQPNPEMPPYQFKHLLASHILSWGNAYCEIERDGGGRPKWLWPVTPDRVSAFRRESGTLAYRITQGSDIESANMLHIRGMGFDGIVGYSPIKMAQESIGAGVAMDSMAASFFGNGANVGGVLKHPGKLSPEGRKNLADSWTRASSGKNAGKWLVAEEGLDPVRMTIPPDEAQFLESRKFQPIEICRWFGVPPHKVFALDRATWSNIEHQELEFVSDAVQPIVTQMEQEADLKLFGRVNRGVLYTKLNMAALLRGDLKSRYEAYEVAHRNGWLNADEIRGLEDLNPLPKGLGKLYVMQAQMMTREQIKEGKQAEPAPSPSDPIEEAEPPPDEEVIARARRMVNLARSHK
jgi:HK97 family phage portal protein